MTKPQGKKSPNTKTSNNKQQRKEAEEKTAIHGPKSKSQLPPMKKASKASVSIDKKKSSTNLKPRKSHSNINTAYEKTIDSDEKKKPKKEKWSGEEAASKYLKSIESINVTEEYEDIQKIPDQSERSKIWAGHSSRNRNPDYKCYDDNRVIVQMCKSDYINGTKVNVPNFSPLVYLMQLPKVETPDAVEEFWRVVFHEQCQTVHIIAKPDEIQNPGIEKMFAQESGGYLYVNGFFVNTRKVEKDGKNADQFVVELLPEGCSNSVMCTVFMHTYWRPLVGPERFYAPLKAAQQIAKEHGPSPLIIASVNGAGRNAALLSMAVIIDQLTKGKEPKVSDIVRTIREQRPKSVDSLYQYGSLYLTTNHWIKSKVHGNDDFMKRLHQFQNKVAAIVPMNSQMKLATEE